MRPIRDLKGEPPKYILTRHDAHIPPHDESDSWLAVDEYTDDFEKACRQFGWQAYRLAKMCVGRVPVCIGTMHFVPTMPGRESNGNAFFYNIHTVRALSEAEVFDIVDGRWGIRMKTPPGTPPPIVPPKEEPPDAQP